MPQVHFTRQRPMGAPTVYSVAHRSMKHQTSWRLWVAAQTTPTMTLSLYGSRSLPTRWSALVALVKCAAYLLFAMVGKIALSFIDLGILLSFVTMLRSGTA